MGTCYEEMSYRTALTRHLGMQATFESKNIKANMFGFLLGYLFFQLYENAYNHKSSTKTQFYEFFVIECCITLNIHFFNHSLNQILNFMIRVRSEMNSFLYINYKLLFYSLILSKTTSDCITLLITQPSQFLCFLPQTYSCYPLLVCVRQNV